MTEDKRKKIITGCIIAGMVVLIIVLTTVILKVKKTKVGTADKTDPAEYSSSDITSKETESVTVPQEQPTEYSSSDITSKETESITVPQEQPTTPAGNDKITNTVNYSVILKKIIRGVTEQMSFFNTNALLPTIRDMILQAGSLKVTLAM